MLNAYDYIKLYVCDECDRAWFEKPANLSYHQHFTGEGATPATRMFAGPWKPAKRGKWVKCGPIRERAAQLIEMPGEDWMEDGPEERSTSPEVFKQRGHRPTE